MTDGATPASPLRILRPLARGRRSLLYEARLADGGRSVALNVLRDVPAKEIAALSRALGPLTTLDHPNVARLQGVREADGHAALVLDLVEGPTLAQALEDEPFTAEQADDLGRGILEGLAALHAAGFTHPRLAPEDVLLSVGATGPVPRLAGAGVVAATTGEPGDVRDDVWNAGMLLHALLTGHVPEADETLTELGPEVPDRIAQAVTRALRADVDQRAQSAREVLAVWEGRGESGTGRVAPARAWDDRAVKRLRRLWTDTTPLEDSWDDLKTDPRLAAPSSSSWIPIAVLAALLAFLAFIAWWGGG